MYIEIKSTQYISIAPEVNLKNSMDYKNTMPRSMMDFNVSTEECSALATVILGVDTLLGGDVLHTESDRHVLADVWFDGVQTPDVYHDAFAEQMRAARESGMLASDFLKTNRAAAEAFVERFELDDRLVRFAQHSEGYVQRLSRAVRVMLDVAMAQASGNALPTVEERYAAGMGVPQAAVRLIDIAPLQEQLRGALELNGFSVTRSRPLTETYTAWRQAEEHVSPQEIEPRLRKIMQQLISDFRAGVLNPLAQTPPFQNSGVEQFSFSTCELQPVSGVDFTGGVLYSGGEHQAGVFEYSAQYPFTQAELVVLCAHEYLGHYVTGAIIDLLWKGGHASDLLAMPTLCTPSAAMHEGWAERMLHLVYGSPEAIAEQYGNAMLVELVHDDITNAAKHNAPLLHQWQQQPLTRLQTVLQQEYIQTAEDTAALLGMWTQHPIIGPMYAPGYAIGSRTVENARNKQGPTALAAHMYSTPVDLVSMLQ